MENQIRNLPIEIQWHIMKFTRHPVAELFMKEVFRSIVPRDMNNNGPNREPYKIVWRKRNFKHIYNIAFCDKPKHKNSNTRELFSDEEDYDSDGFRRILPYTREWYDNPLEYDPADDPYNNREPYGWSPPASAYHSDSDSDSDHDSSDEPIRPVKVKRNFADDADSEMLCRGW